MNYTYTILGTIGIDSVETPFGTGTRELGGSATFLAIASSFFVSSPKILSIVGNDFTEEHQDIFRKKSINISDIDVVSNKKTLFWKAKYHPDMNDRTTIETQLNALENFNPDISKINTDNSTSFLGLGNIDPDLQLHILENTSVTYAIGDTMNFWIESKPKTLKALIPKLNCFIINDNEAKLLAKKENPIQCGKTIQEMGCKTVIIKKGEHGAILFHEENLFLIPSFPIQNVVDPTGAGDCFAGGFLGYIAATNSFSFATLKQAICYGTVCASFCIEAFGTRSIQNITRNNIEERISYLKSCISLA